jgi:hypothetical protein
MDTIGTTIICKEVKTVPAAAAMYGCVASRRETRPPLVILARIAGFRKLFAVVRGWQGRRGFDGSL